MSKIESQNRSAKVVSTELASSVDSSFASGLLITADHDEASSTPNPVAQISSSIQNTVNDVPQHFDPSPCEILPSYAGLNLIRTNVKDHNNVHAVVTKLLESRSEISHYYDSEYQSYQIIVVEGSLRRIYHLNCYVHAESKNHILELRKVGGSDGFGRFSFDLMTLLHQAFDLQYSSPILNAGILGKRAADSLPEDSSLDTVVTLQLYRDGVDHIVAMAKHNVLENKLLGMNAICDMTNAKNRSLLCDKECVQKVVEVINFGLIDIYPEVQEQAVIATEALCGFPVYLNAFGQMHTITSLLNQLKLYPAKERFLHDHAIRSASRTILFIAPTAVDSTIKALHSFNVTNSNEWLSFVDERVSDATARSILSKVSDIFAASSLPASSEFPCELVPSNLHINHFHVQDSNIVSVEDKLKRCFQRISSVATSFIPETHSFRSKLICQSDIITVHSSIFFDRESKNFVVEVRRLSGEGLVGQMQDFYTTLERLYREIDSSSDAPTVDFVSKESEELLGSCPVTFEQFMVSIGHIISFARDRYAESRIEGLKMLIDCRFSSVSAAYLEERECVDTISDALVYLARDSMQDVQELAVIAIDAFTTWREQYAAAFLSRKEAIEKILQIIRSSSLSAENFFDHALKLRAAWSFLAVIFSRDAAVGRAMISSVLSIDSKEGWEHYSKVLIEQDPILAASLQRIGELVF